MVKLVDTHDSKSCGATHVGSTPTGGTILRPERGASNGTPYENVLRNLACEKKRLIFSHNNLRTAQYDVYI